LKKLLIIVLCCCLMLCVLAACSSQSNSSLPNTSTVTPNTSSTSNATTSEDENASVPDSTAGTSSTEDSSTGASTPETTGPNTPVTSNPTTDKTPETSNPPATDPPAKPGETNPPATKPPQTTPPVTDPPVTEKPVVTPTNVAAQKITATLSAYTSANEPSPYLKGTPIYQILYGGERAQVGDTLTFKLSIEPANHTDTISVTVTDNITYSLVGNTLTVSVNSFGDIGSGRITIYACDPSSGAIHTSSKISFAIDAAGNPYDNLTSILSSYIRVLGMNYTSVSEGYTAKDPSLSFTQFEGAPAWDDQILKSESDWVKRCFWLLEKYANSGFKNVNFIETSTSFGFSASK